jgi:hypothetical protein
MLLSPIKITEIIKFGKRNFEFFYVTNEPKEYPPVGKIYENYWRVVLINVEHQIDTIKCLNGSIISWSKNEHWITVTLEEITPELEYMPP